MKMPGGIIPENPPIQKLWASMSVEFPDAALFICTNAPVFTRHRPDSRTASRREAVVYEFPEPFCAEQGVWPGAVFREKTEG
jgi:hypothetical protein